MTKMNEYMMKKSWNKIIGRVLVACLAGTLMSGISFASQAEEMQEDTIAENLFVLDDEYEELIADGEDSAENEQEEFFIEDEQQELFVEEDYVEEEETPSEIEEEYSEDNELEEYLIDNFYSEEDGWNFGLNNSMDVQAGDLPKFDVVDLPSSYSSVAEGYVPAVRNQGRFGTCWAHAAMTLSEINAIKKGLSNYGVNNTDFSERYFAYAFYNREGINDPLDNTLGDYNKSPDGESWDACGGNSQKATLMLLNWDGPAYEKDFPYEDMPNGISAEEYNTAEIHLQNVYFYNTEAKRTAEGRNLLKQAIMDHGAITCSFAVYSELMNGANIYSDTLLSPNHAVAIVGWDDEYDKENFKSHNLVQINQSEWNKKEPSLGNKYYKFGDSSVSPKENGAWLIRNSWGEKSGQNGYFWISYEDESSCDFIAYDFEEKDNYDHQFYYDGNYTLSSTNVFANKDIAQVYKNTLDTYQQLSAVGFGCIMPDSDFDVQIYLNPEEDKPTSGTPLLDKKLRCHFDADSFLTFPLVEEVLIPSGATFSIVITPCQYSFIYVSMSGFDCEDNVLPHTIYRNGVEINDYTYRVKAYTKDVDINFDDAEIIGVNKEYEFKGGAEIKPEFQVKIGNTILDPDTYYCEFIGDCYHVGSVEILVKGKDKPGECRAKYKIVPKSLSELTDVFVYLPDTDFVYTGGEYNPTVELHDNDTAYCLVKGKDVVVTYENCINAGEATVKFTGLGDYKGEIKRHFIIQPMEISFCLIYNTMGYVEYTGSEITPHYAVELWNRVLVQGKDYEVAYSNNILPGEGKITLTGKGNFTGSHCCYFTISPVKQVIFEEEEKEEDVPVSVIITTESTGGVVSENEISKRPENDGNNINSQHTMEKENNNEATNGSDTESMDKSANNNVKDLDNSYEDSNKDGAESKNSSESVSDEVTESKDMNEYVNDEVTDTEISNIVNDNVTILIKQKYNIAHLISKIEEPVAKYKVISLGGKASVTKNGLLTARREGLVKVIPYVREGRKLVAREDAAIVVNIVNPRFTISKVALGLGTLSLEDYFVVPELKQNVTYTVSYSRNPVINIDSKTGKITLLRKGRAKISITYSNAQGYQVKYSKYISVKG